MSKYRVVAKQRNIALLGGLLLMHRGSLYHGDDFLHPLLAVVSMLHRIPVVVRRHAT
jgi:hypothetical protein